MAPLVAAAPHLGDTVAMFALAFTAAAAPAALAAPVVMVLGGVGLPNLLHAHAEVFLADAWSVEVGGGVGLLPSTLTAGARWSPAGTWWGREERNALRLAPGATVFLFPSHLQEGLLSINVDLAWIHQGPSGWGVTAGVKLGAGPAWGQVADGLKIEPGIEVVPLQIGVVR